MKTSKYLSQESCVAANCKPDRRCWRPRQQQLSRNANQKWRAIDRLQSLVVVDDDANNGDSEGWGLQTKRKQRASWRPLGYLLGFSILLLFAACDGRRDIRAYYFPVDSLSQGLTYAYASEEGDSTDRRYWYYQASERDSGIFLSGTQYDRYFEINQIVQEKIVKNGSLARKSFLYERDTATGKSVTIHTDIESPNLFPFRVSDSLGIFLYRLRYTPPFDSSASIYLVRNRHYLGDGPEFELDGKKYPTVRFRLREAIGQSAEGTAEIEGIGEEWYAKGLGLVYFRKSFGKDGAIRYAFRLRERFDMDELRRRAEETLHSH